MSIYAAFYQFGIYAYFTAIKLVALFDNKAKLFVKGREGLAEKMKLAMAAEKRQSIWMHCASLGEFEQGRPVLEALRKLYPQYAVVVTFFSPSGYEVRKDYKGADHVFYLPMDSDKNARQLLDTIRPALCIFVKYEFWYFYLSCIASRNIPVILISSIFNKNQGFFKWYGGLQRHMLRCFSHIFVQDEPSVSLLKGIGIDKVTVSGDTRFDRVIVAAGQVAALPAAAAFGEGHKVLVAGSTWKEDEVFLHKVLALLPANWKLILVPHEVHAAHIAEIEKLFGDSAVCWSQVKDGSMPTDKRVLVVNKVGLLLQLYSYGTAAWIGGGFGKDGVHNVLEAAVYGIPCFYGPVFHQFLEAKELIEKGGAYSVNEPAELVAALEGLGDSRRYEQCANAAKRYVLSKGGATAVVTGYVAQHILSRA